MSTDLRFTLVPVRPRRDGWTPLRQTMFILALAKTRCVAAARSVGLSWQTAYRLHARADAESFAAAWDRAVAWPLPGGGFTGRALGGVATPITYRGHRIGERRRYDDRLAVFLLSTRHPEYRETGQRSRRTRRLPPKRSRKRSSRSKRTSPPASHIRTRTIPSWT